MWTTAFYWEKDLRHTYFKRAWQVIVSSQGVSAPNLNEYLRGMRALEIEHKTKPGLFRDRVFLVAGTGFEPATSGL